MKLGPLIDQLLRGEDLSSEQARSSMGWFMDGEASEAEIAGFLVAMKAKGATGAELASFSRAMRERARTLDHEFEDLLDTCGTGGGRPSFNISTAAAIVASAAGARVAKHGNRAMSGNCGSADVLEALGVELVEDEARLRSMLGNHGFAFFFAPSHHPAMRHVGPVRRSLGIRTVFNQLGPLSNPAGAARQLIGVYDPVLAPAMAEAAQSLGVARVWVVHSDDGLDEVSPAAGTRVWDGASEFTVSPEEFGLERTSPDAYDCGSSIGENGQLLSEALAQIDSPRSKAILPAASAALYIAGLADSLKAAGELACETVASGRAWAKLQELVSASKSP